MISAKITSKIERIPDIVDSKIGHDFIFMFFCFRYCLIDEILHFEHDFLSKYPLYELQNSLNLHPRPEILVYKYYISPSRPRLFRPSGYSLSNCCLYLTER